MESPAPAGGTYGHVIDELEEAPRVDAEQSITAAREQIGAHRAA